MKKVKPKLTKEERAARRAVTKANEALYAARWRGARDAVEHKRTVTVDETD